MEIHTMASIETVAMVHPGTGVRRVINFYDVQKYRNSGYVPEGEEQKVAIEKHEEEVANPPIEKMTLPKLKEIAEELKIRRYKRMSKDELLSAIADAKGEASDDSVEPTEEE
jgi:hypothetical protein